MLFELKYQQSMPSNTTLYCYTRFGSSEPSSDTFITKV